MRTFTAQTIAGSIALVTIAIATSPRSSLEARVGQSASEVDSALIVPRADRDAETARLRALGINVPDGGVVLERPWDPPFTRRSYVVPQAWFTAPTPDSVSADALAKDLPVLATVMARAYGGWEMAKHRGWNWDRWFADWTSTLTAHAGERLALADAFAPMKDLMAVQLDNHTTIPLRGPRFGSASRSALIDGAPGSPCTEVVMSDGRRVALDVNDPSQRPRRAQRWNAATRAIMPATYLSLPATRGEPIAVRCGSDSFRMTMAWPSDDPLRRTSLAAAARDAAIRAMTAAAADGPDMRVLEPGIAYLRLPTFSVANAQLIEQRMGTWPKPSGERVLIVDLRDNGGGDVALQTLRGWVDVRRTQRAQATHRHQGASCLYHALRWGYVTASTASIKPPASASMTERLQASMNPLFRQSPADCPSQFEDSDSGWDFRQHVMRPPGQVDGRMRIMVLVNNGTGSDGEFMMMLLASLPESVIVGSNTYGVAQYVQPGYSVLPHTRLPFRIALGTSDGYGDNRSFDGYGFDVDILLSTQDDQRPENILALARYIGGLPARAEP